MKMKLNENKYWPLLCFVLVFFYLICFWHRLLLQSLIPFDGNMIRLFYPSWIIGKDLLLNHGSLLWDSFRNMGQPFLADPQNQALYPLNLIGLLMNFLDYQRISIVFHTLLAAFPSYFIGKNIFKNNSSAIFFAFFMGFNGFFLARVTLPPHFATMAWLPLSIYFFLNRRTIFLGFSLGLQWLAGYPPFFILTLIILFIFLFDDPNWRLGLKCLGTGVLISLTLTAIQWIPFLEMLSCSVRPLFLEQQNSVEYSIHPLEMVRQIFFPSFILNKSLPISNSDQAMISFYFGPLMTLMASIGAFGRLRQKKIFLVLSLVGIFMSLGQYNKIYQSIPLLSVFRFPSHWMIVGCLGVSLLAAQGISMIRYKKLRMGLVGLIAVDFLLYAWPMHTAWGDMDFFSQSPYRLQGLDNVTKGQRIFHTPSILSSVPTWSMSSKENWMIMKAALIPSIATTEGIKEITSYHVLTSQRLVAFVSRLTLQQDHKHLFSVAGISKKVSLTNEALYKPFPSAQDFIVSSYDVSPGPIYMTTNSSVNILTVKPGYIELTVNGGGTCVLRETAFPGWEARVNHKKMPIKLFEDIFPSVSLSDMNNHVVFIYRPISFMIGRGITLVGLLSLIFIFLLNKKNVVR